MEAEHDSRLVSPTSYPSSLVCFLLPTFKRVSSPSQKSQISFLVYIKTFLEKQKCLSIASRLYDSKSFCSAGSGHMEKMEARKWSVDTGTCRDTSTLVLDP